MHRVRGEVRLAAGRARPQGNALNDQKVGTLAKAARDVLQLRLALATIGA